MVMDIRPVTWLGLNGKVRGTSVLHSEVDLIKLSAVGSSFAHSLTTDKIYIHFHCF